MVSVVVVSCVAFTADSERISAVFEQNITQMSQSKRRNSKK